MYILQRINQPPVIDKYFKYIGEALRKNHCEIPTQCGNYFLWDLLVVITTHVWMDTGHQTADIWLLQLIHYIQHTVTG